MKVSVIIPTRDRAEALDHCLTSLEAQRLSREQFEVVVVDNGSSDSTPDVLAAHARCVQLVPCHAPEPGLHVGRHTGLRNARSEILVFADDDIVAGPGWLEALVHTFQDPDVALAGGNNLPLFESDPPPWLREWWAEQSHERGRALGYLSILDFGTGRFEIDPAFVWGCNFSIRKSALLDAGGFHPDGFPREMIHLRGDGETHVSDHVKTSGAKAMFDSAASVQHRVPANRMSFDYLLRRAYMDGISSSYRNLRLSGGVFTRNAVLAQARSRLASGLVHLDARLRHATPAQSDLAVLKARLKNVYWDGFRFHQARCRSDAALLEWVMRENYLDPGVR